MIFRSRLSPGDVLMLTAALRDLHISCPGMFETDVDVTASCRQLFSFNPNITELRGDKDAEVIDVHYPIIHNCNEGAYHFIHGYTRYIEETIGVRIPVTKMRGEIFLSDQEKKWISQVGEMTNDNRPFWIIDAGCKHDYTAKHWCPGRFQDVVNQNPFITFVQIGTKEQSHYHPVLKGNNVINLIGKTDMRQLVRLMYHAYGVITPVSLPMHLAAAVEMKPEFKRKTRPCIVIAGGREPSHWEAYTNHMYLHTCGKLYCCDNGGCWRSRNVPLGDGSVNKDGKKHDESICKNPVKTEHGNIIPKCLEMITAEDVTRHIREYMLYDYKNGNFANRI